MMNKALEIIEAHELFAIDCENIRVVIHPEAIVLPQLRFQMVLRWRNFRSPICACRFRMRSISERSKFTPVASLDWSSCLNCASPNRTAIFFTALNLAAEVVSVGGSMRPCLMRPTR